MENAECNPSTVLTFIFIAHSKMLTLETAFLGSVSDQANPSPVAEADVSYLGSSESCMELSYFNWWILDSNTHLKK